MPAIALGLVSIAGCSKAESTPTPLVTVQAEHPEMGTIVEHIPADAVLAPIAQAAISPKITAPVRRFYVQRGSHVKAGQLLATLENRDLTAAALDNRGTYTAAQAAYATATQAQVPEDYQKAQLDEAQAKANLELNQSIVTARKQLFAQGAIPGRDLDTAQAALVQAQAAYDTAAKHLESQKSVSRKASLEAAKGQLTSAEGKYQGAQAQVAYSEIRSPIAGFVTDRPLFAGETAAAGSTLLTVMDTSALLAKIHLAHQLAQQMKVGDAATVTVPGVADPVPAKVALISPALDPGSTTVEIWLRIENRKGTLKVGTPVHASIFGRQAKQALTVPSSALLTAQDGSKSVMVVGADGAAHSKPVSVGITDDGRVQITSGLTAGDMVITSGNYALDEGTKVKVGPAEADDSKKPDAAKEAK
ncbi:MAG TPA: efflux RND transporter periplasmic adaptor subunit [Acidobacteriaceae bacterium]|nr:efflux RND transporter periplasmic adaptor subunit [Acidobacteriaceae bacterium]